MGWWSENIMGGDTPHDMFELILKTCIPNYKEHSSEDYDMEPRATDLENNMDELIEGGFNMHRWNQPYYFQVLAAYVMKAGAKCSAKDHKIIMLNISDREEPEWNDRDSLRELQNLWSSYNGEVTLIEEFE
jgi:hypothetical protein